MTSLRQGRRGSRAERGCGPERREGAEEKGVRRGGRERGWGRATPRCRCRSSGSFPPSAASRPVEDRRADVGGRGIREVALVERCIARAPAAWAPALTPEAGPAALGTGPGGRSAKRSPGPWAARREHCLERVKGRSVPATPETPPLESLRFGGLCRLRLGTALPG